MQFSCNHISNPIEFESLIFHATGCFGTCPTYHLQLNKDKSILLYSEQVFKEGSDLLSFDLDTSKMGYFTGHCIDSSFQKLISELKTFGLDTVNFEGPTYTCGPEITIIVYYNGKRRILKSMCPTPRAGKLISSLYEICKASNFDRTDESFVIEAWEASR